MATRIKLLDPIEGYEEDALIRTGKKGEIYYDMQTGKVCTYTEYDNASVRIVLTPKPPPYQWPKINGEPMGGWGFACDADGQVLWHEYGPTMVESDSEWESRGVTLRVSIKALNIPAPLLKPGEVFRNPHYQKKGDE